MPLLIPIQVDETFQSRVVALVTVDVTRRAEPAALLASADVKTGEGTMVIVDAISTTLDAAR